MRTSACVWRLPVLGLSALAAACGGPSRRQEPAEAHQADSSRRCDELAAGNFDVVTSRPAWRDYLERSFRLGVQSIQLEEEVLRACGVLGGPDTQPFALRQGPNHGEGARAVCATTLSARAERALGGEPTTEQVEERDHLAQLVGVVGPALLAEGRALGERGPDLVAGVPADDAKLLACTLAAVQLNRSSAAAIGAVVTAGAPLANHPPNDP